MSFPTRRTFLKTVSLSAIGLPLLAQEPGQTSSRKYRVCEIGQDGDYGHMAGAFAEFPNVTMVAVARPVYADFREMLSRQAEGSCFFEKQL